MKKGGKNIFLLLLCIGNVLNAVHVSLSSADIYGKPIREIDADRPFEWIIQVRDVNNEGNLTFNQMVNAKRFTSEPPETKKIFNHGKLDQIVYKIRSYAHNPGIYKNIKALVHYEGSQYSSNPIMLEVKPAGASRHDPLLHKDHPIMIDLSLDKKKVVVGEQVIGTVKIYAKPELRFQVRPDFFNNQSIKHAKLYQNKKIENINGESYTVLELQWALYPQASGHYSLVLPVDYEVPIIKSTGFFRVFMSDQRLVNSNCITLDVDPLPNDARSVTLVGRALNVSLEVSPAVCKEQEGITGVLEIAFEGDLENFTYPMLQGLPDSVHCFFSRATEQEPLSVGHEARKKIEFILQPKQAGSIEIPEQIFWYYDVATRTKKSVKSNSVVLTILPKIKQSIETKQDSEKDEAGPLWSNESLAELHMVRSPHSDYQIPWWLFFFVVMGTGFLSGCTIIKERFKVNMQPKKVALLRLLQAEKNNDFRSLYSIFVQFIVSRGAFDLGHAKAPEQIITQLPITGTQKKELAEIFQQLAVYAFDDSRLHDYDKYLFKKIEIWIKLLDRCL